MTKTLCVKIENKSKYLLTHTLRMLECVQAKRKPSPANQDKEEHTMGIILAAALVISAGTAIMWAIW